MPADLQVLNTPPRQRVEDVVAQLESLLEKARAGDINGFAHAVTYADGSIGIGWTDHEDYGKLLGVVARLQVRLGSA